MADYDLDELLRGAEAAAFAESHGMSICPEISRHKENMDPPTTIAVIKRLQRAEAALRHIWNHPLRDECAADDLRWMARTALNYKDETALRESADAGQEGTS